MENQEQFVINYYNKKRDLRFIEIGANDGITISNTVHLEKDYGWTGICVEANPDHYSKLINNRSAKCFNCCAYSSDTTLRFCKIDGYSEMLSGVFDTYDPRHVERIKKEVAERNQKMQYINLPARSLQSIMEESNMLEIEYLCIDTEGSELEILKGIDYNKSRIKIISLEDNYNDRKADDLLLKHGYGFMERVCLDNFYLLM